MRTIPARIAVSQSEAAEMLGLSLRTLQNFIRSKQIPVRKIGRRTLVEVRALEAFVSRDHKSSVAHGSARSNEIRAKGFVVANETERHSGAVHSRYRLTFDPEREGQ